MREYVQFWKLDHGKARGEIFIPQAYAPGIQAQIDWYEAVAELAGDQLTIGLSVSNSFSTRTQARANDFLRGGFKFLTNSCS